MENHISELSKICRLRRKKILLLRNYINAKTCVENKEKLSILFGYDNSQDNKEIYPTNLCHKCSSKLSKVDGVTKFEMCSIATFYQHVDGSCEHCRIHRFGEHNFEQN